MGSPPHSLRHLSCVFSSGELQQDNSLSFLQVKAERIAELAVGAAQIGRRGAQRRRSLANRVVVRTPGSLLKPGLV